jgi:hypothetical protein
LLNKGGLRRITTRYSKTRCLAIAEPRTNSSHLGLEVDLLLAVKEVLARARTVSGILGFPLVVLLQVPPSRVSAVSAPSASSGKYVVLVFAGTLIEIRHMPNAYLESCADGTEGIRALFVEDVRAGYFATISPQAVEQTLSNLFLNRLGKQKSEKNT